MRISDWSSDVCSSDLKAQNAARILARIVTSQPFHRCVAAAFTGGTRRKSMRLAPMGADGLGRHSYQQVLKSILTAYARCCLWVGERYWGKSSSYRTGSS